MTTPSDDEALKHVHSADFFGDSREHWWNPDFLALMAERWQVGAVRSVLEVGSGFGHWSRALLQVLPEQARLIGVDRESASVEEATRRAARAGISERVEYRVGAAEALPFVDGAFDFVTCQTLLIHLPDPVLALGEMRRVLRPGGLLVAIEPVNLAGGMAAISFATDASVDIVLTLRRFQLVCEVGKKRLGEGDNSLGERLPGLVLKAGFADLMVHQTDRPWSMIPPYTRPHEVATRAEWQRALREEMPMWRRKDTERYFLAGGGAKSEFQDSWSLAIAEFRRMVADADAGRLALAGGLVGIIVSARNPG